MAKLSNITYYSNGVSGASEVIGWESSRTRVVRFEFTTGDSGATKISISTTNGTISHQNGTSITKIPFYVTTSSTSHKNAVASSGCSVTGYITKDGNVFSGSANVVLKENTTYYVWFFPNSETYGWAYWHSTDTYYTTYTLSGTSKFTLTTSAGNGASITVRRTSSSAAKTGELTSGASVYKGDKLKITFTPDDNYLITTRTVNGTMYTSGNTHTVSSNVSVVVAAAPSKSTIAATDANIGSTSTIIVTRYNSAYTHTITYEFGEKTGTVCSKSSDTSIAWTVPTAFYSQIPSAKSGTCTLTITTYDGSTSLGSNTCTMTVTAAKNSCAPSVSGTVVDGNEKIVTYFTGDNNTIIKYRSDVVCTILAEAKNSAEIVSMRLNGVEYTESEGNVKTINDTKKTTFIFKATDSRGYSSSFTATPNIIEYVKPTCNPALKRTSPTSNIITLTAKGNFYRGSFGIADNTLTVKYRYKEIGGSFGPWTTIDHSEISISTSGYSISDYSLGDVFDYQKRYIFEIRVNDGTDDLTASIVTKTITVQKGIPVFDWGESDFAFHVPVTIDGREVATKQYVEEYINAAWEASY